METPYSTNIILHWIEVNYSRSSFIDLYMKAEREAWAVVNDPENLLSAKAGKKGRQEWAEILLQEKITIAVEKFLMDEVQGMVSDLLINALQSLESKHWKTIVQFMKEGAQEWAKEYVKR